MTPNAAPVQTLDLPRARLARWTENFVRRHGESVFQADGRHLALDGSWFELRSPFSIESVEFTGTSTDTPHVPADWAVVLVRRGGFAVGRLAGETLTASKVGQRHVQGRTKAGGQSQQRFARRRANQAREAYAAAGEHAVRLLSGLRGPVVTGGDHEALDEVFSAPGLTELTRLAHPGHVPDPRRAALEAVIAATCGWRVTVFNSPDQGV